MVPLTPITMPVTLPTLLDMHRIVIGHHYRRYRNGILKLSRVLLVAPAVFPLKAINACASCFVPAYVCVPLLRGAR